MDESSSGLRDAPSRLYRSRFLQVNTRVKALDEICKIYRLLHRSTSKFQQRSRPNFFILVIKSYQTESFRESFTQFCNIPYTGAQFFSSSFQEPASKQNHVRAFRVVLSEESSLRHGLFLFPGHRWTCPGHPGISPDTPRVWLSKNRNNIFCSFAIDYLVGPTAAIALTLFARHYTGGQGGSYSQG